jgi:hypothetical protein
MPEQIYPKVKKKCSGNVSIFKGKKGNDNKKKLKKDND